MMGMMGIGAIGAAIGGLAKGYQEGQRFQADMDEREQSKRLRDIQIESYGLNLSKQKRELAIEDELRNATEEVKRRWEAEQNPPAQQTNVGISPPAASASTVGQSNRAISPAGSANPQVGDLSTGDVDADQMRSPAIPGGIASPAQAATQTAQQTTQAKPRQNANIQLIERIADARNEILLKHNRIDPKKALEDMKMFSALHKENIIDGLSHYMSNPTEEGRREAISKINSTGQSKFDPNTRFEIVDRDMGAGMKVRDVVAIAPNGAKSSLVDARFNALNPDQALRTQFTLGQNIADLNIKQISATALDEHNRAMRELEKGKLSAQVNHYQQMHSLQVKRLALDFAARGDEDGTKALNRYQATSEMARKEIFATFGISKEQTATDLDKLGDKAKIAYQKKLDSAVMAHAIWGMNNPLSFSKDQNAGAGEGKKDPKASLSSAEASMVVRDLQASNFSTENLFSISKGPDGKQVLTRLADEFGEYILWRGKKVYTPFNLGLRQKDSGEAGRPLAVPPRP